MGFIAYPSHAHLISALVALQSSIVPNVLYDIRYTRKSYRIPAEFRVLHRRHLPYPDYRVFARLERNLRFALLYIGPVIQP